MPTSLPQWEEIEAQPWFSDLTPEQKSTSLLKWRTDFASQQPLSQEETQVLDTFVTNKGRQYLTPAPKETPGYLSQLGGALSTGYQQMASGLGATFNALTGDTQDVASEMVRMAELQRQQQAAETPEDIKFRQGLAEAEKAYEQAQGPMETLGALAQFPAAIAAQPGAAFKTAVQSAPNVLISGATQLAGRAIGGLLGVGATIETGPGAILGGLAGYVAGGVLSNTLMEAGPAIFDVLNERTQGAASGMTADQIAAYLKANPDIVNEGLTTGAIRGTVIGAVESLGMKGAGSLLTMPERAAARAVQKELIGAGVDVASKEAVDAALLNPAIREATKVAADAAKAQFSSAGNLARLAGASAIETGAAGAGEIAAQAASGQKISPTEATMEMLGEVALSPVMAAATKVVEGAQYLRAPTGEAPAGQVAPVDPVQSQIDKGTDAATQALKDAAEAVQRAFKVSAQLDASGTGSATAAVLRATATNAANQGAAKVADTVEAAAKAAADAAEQGATQPWMESVSERLRGGTPTPATTSEVEKRLTSLTQPAPASWMPSVRQQITPTQPAAPAPATPSPVEQRLAATMQPTAVATPSLGTISPVATAPAGVAPVTQPTPTPTNAPSQRIVPENRVEERPSVDEGGPTAETGGGNRPLQSGQVQPEVATTLPPAGTPPAVGQAAPAPTPTVAPTTAPKKQKAAKAAAPVAAQPQPELPLETPVEPTVTETPVEPTVTETPAAQPTAEWQQVRDQLTSPKAIKLWEGAATETSTERKQSIQDETLAAQNYFDAVGSDPVEQKKTPSPKKPAAEKPTAQEKPAEKKTPAAKKTPSPKRQALDAEQASILEDLRKVSRKSSGQTNIGVDPKIAAEMSVLLAKLATVSVKKGILTFQEFVEFVAENASDLWSQLRDMLAIAWKNAAMFFPQAQKLPSAEEVATILARYEPAMETAPAITLPEPIVGNAPTEQELGAKLGFGQKGKKSISQILEEDPIYLFQTLFDDEMTKGIKDRAKLEKARSIVRRMPQYAAFRKGQSLSDEDYAGINAQYADEVEQLVSDLSDLGLEVSVEPNGSISIQRSETTKKYQSLITKHGFIFNQPANAFTIRDHGRFVEFGNDVSAATTAGGRVGVTGERVGVPGGRRNFVSAGRRAAIAERRDGVASMPDASSLTREEVNSSTDKDARKALISGGQRAGMPSDIVAEQLTDAALISNAHARGEGMFMLASDPGTGKTFVMAAAIKSMVSRLKASGVKAPRVIFVTRNQYLIEQASKEMAPFEVTDNIEFITYASLDKSDSTNPPKDSDILVFDEAHEIRYSREGQSTRSSLAEKWIRKSKFVLMSSATPYEDLSQMEFLAPTGIFKEFDVPNLYEGKQGFYGFASVFGGRVTLSTNGKPSGVQWLLQGDAALAAQSEAREYLRKRGVFSQRAARLPENMVFFDYPLVEADAAWVDLHEKMEKARSTKGLDSNAFAFITNLQKRALEASKANAAIDMAKKELSEGRKVAIFVETKSERDYNLPEEIAKFNAYEEAGGDMSAEAREAAGVMFEGGIKFFRALVNEGVTTIKFPSAQDVFKAAFKDDVSFFTSDEPGATGTDNLGRWESGETHVLVTTMARGGTGLSLHDRKGNDPRTQIVIVLPWRGTDVEQVSKRIARYGMETPARINWLFTSQIPSEKKLASIVGARMANMGAIVKGVSTDISQRVLSAVTNFQIDRQTGQVLMEDDAVEPPTDAGLEAVKQETRLLMSIPATKIRQLTPRDIGSVKEALSVISKTLPFIKDVVTIDTKENLLRLPDLTQPEREAIEDGSEGFFNSANGRAVVVVDNISLLDEHGSPAAAIADTALHEVLHRGFQSIRTLPEFFDLNWDLTKETKRYVTDQEIDQLVARGYSQYQGWRTNVALEMEAREEVYVRKLNEIINREGVEAINRPIVRSFLDWVKAFLTLGLKRFMPKRGTDQYYLYWAKRILNASQHAPEYGNGSVRRSAATLQAPSERETSQRRLDYLETKNKEALDRLELPSTPGTHGQQDWKAVLEKIRDDNLTTRLEKTVIEALLQLDWNGLNFVVTSDGRLRNAGEWTDGSPATISINLRAAGRGRISLNGLVIHELLHHATARKIKNPANARERALVASLETLRERVTNYAKQSGEYGRFKYELDSLDEFIAALFPNRAHERSFVAFLDRIPDSYKPGSRASQFIRSALSRLTEILSRLFRTGEVGGSTVLGEAIKQSIALVSVGTPIDEGFTKQEIDRATAMYENLRTDLVTLNYLSQAAMTDNGYVSLAELHRATGLPFDQFMARIRADDAAGIAVFEPMANPESVAEQDKKFLIEMPDGTASMRVAYPQMVNGALRDRLAMNRIERILASGDTRQSPIDSGVDPVRDPDTSAADMQNAAPANVAESADAQVFGVKRGEAYSPRSVDASRSAAVRFLGLTFDKLGVPVITPAATAKVKEVTARILQDTASAIQAGTALAPSAFMAEYLRYAGPEASVPGVALQAELIRYGTLLAARENDDSVRNSWLGNYNNVILGNYFTVADSARALQMRGKYSSAANEAFNELAKTMREAAVEGGRKLGVNGDEVDQEVAAAGNDLENAIDETSEPAKTINNAKPPADGIDPVRRVLESLSGRAKDSMAFLLRKISLVNEANRRLQEIRARNAGARQSWLDEVLSSDEDFSDIPNDEAGLVEFIQKTSEEIADLADNLSGLVNVPGVDTGTEEITDVEVVDEAPAPPTPDNPVVDDTTGRELDDAVVEEDASEDEKESEADAAARRVAAIVERFIKQEFKATKFTETLFTRIKDLVVAAAKNEANFNLDTFTQNLSNDLAKEGVSADRVEKLVNLAWAAYLALPEQKAKSILARLRSVPAVSETFNSEKAKDIKRLVSKFIRTPASAKITEAEAIAKLAPQLVRLGVKQATATAVTKAAHDAAIRERASRMARVYERVLAPNKGNYASIIKAFKAAKGKDTSDLGWQMAVVTEFFAKNGLPKEDAELLAQRAFIEGKFSAIFSTAGIRESIKAEARMRKAIANLVASRNAARKRNFDVVRQPDGTYKNLPAVQQARQMNIRSLYRQQVIVPMEEFADFEKQAAAFGASSAEARVLFDLANTERQTKELVSGSRTRLSALIKFIKENTAEMTTDPSGAAGTIANPLIRQQLVRTFLEANGFSPAQIDAATSWVDKQLVKHLIAAKEKALDSALKKQRQYKAGTLAGKQETATLAEKHVARMRELIRLGMADPSLRASQALAEEMGYSSFSAADNRKLVRLDEMIQRATAEGRDTDVARALREMFQLFELRRPPKNALEVLAISYNNNALGGLSTLAINTVAPFGSMVNRMLIDMGRATIRRDMTRVELIANSFETVVKDYVNYMSFALRSDAYTNAMQQQVLQVTRLNRDFRDGLAAFRNTKLSAWKRLTGATRAITAMTDITRRLLSSSDQAWYATMQNYFLKTAGYLTLTKNGITGPEAMNIVKRTSTDASVRMQAEQSLIASMTQRVQSLAGKDDKTVTEELDKLINEPNPNIDEKNTSLRQLDQDIRGTLRALRVPEWNPQRRVREALRELRTQYLAVPIRMKDIARHQLSREIAELVSSDADTQKSVQKSLLDYSTKESEYETGNHRGEDAPIADVLNNFTSLVRLVGNTVLQKNPILGRVLLGYFGVPVNLLNRGAWLTPYGFLRYALVKRYAGKKKAFGISSDVEFYRQSAATELQLRQRLAEAIAGTSALVVVMLLQSVLGDDDEPIFNVTLAGPANKTERDAWIKQGHHQGSLELNVAGKRVSTSWARGLLEPWKMNMILAGAVDDMRLNRKLGHPLNASSMGEYLGAVMAGWHEQASFLGAKSTLGFVAGKGPDTNMLGSLLYKANPIIPFSGLMGSVERLIVGPDQSRGRMGAIWANLPIARSLLTRRDVNALGDPRGFPTGDTLATAANRMYLTGLLPVAITTPPSPKDAEIYKFIMERGTGPGLPQRGAIEARNGLLSDDQWIDYVAFRGAEVKRLMSRSLPRLKKLDDTELTRAMGEISSDATKKAKSRFRLQ